MLALGACGVAGAAWWARADSAGVRALAITAEALSLDAGDPTLERVGRLIYRGGLRLSAGDPRFGGWSDLRVAADGGAFTAVSDRGAWLEARLDYDSRHHLRSLGAARIGSLIDTAGRPLRGFMADAEGLARLPGGGFIVAFERRHRFWRYPAAEPPFSVAPQALPAPAELARLRANGGIEAFTRLSGGALLALAEDSGEGGTHAGWIGDGRTWEWLSYQAEEGFSPTALAESPGGEVLVLERRFSLLGGWSARVVRLARGDIRAGAVLRGAEIARISSPLTRDNFEGLGTARGPRGETLIYLLSDDNFSALQSTLLLMFELAE